MLITKKANLSHCDVSCGSTDVTLSIRISTRPIFSVSDANKHVSTPKLSTLTGNSAAGISSHRCDTVVSNSQFKSSGIFSTSAISKDLVQYVTPPPVKKNAASKRVTGSRVLTSAELCNNVRKR